MSLYLLLVLLAYYILKPVSRALFLSKFDIDKLPWLYILIAGFGGILAYVYTKAAVRSSLQTAVTGAMIFSIAMLLLIWWLIGFNTPWVFYFFNIWVSLFSVMLVSQGWLVAANVFSPREAKRLYGLLGAGAVIGAACGGEFAARAVKYIAPRDLLIASAGFVVLAYIAFRCAIAQRGVSLEGAKGAETEEANVHFKDILGSVKTQRHLQVIVAIMILTFIVDVSIEYQFNAFAKLAFHGSGNSAAQLTAFLGKFYGIYLNLITIVLQIVFTAFVVNRLGVGGTLQVMPVAIGVTSVITFFFSGVWASGSLRLTEAATRYTLNRTGMELLYLPLPLELKNRTKAFIDIFVDRFGRGLGGMLLILFTTVLGFSPRTIAIVTAAFTVPWIFLSHIASKEYIATVRKRLSLRRLDFTDARIDTSDRRTMQLVEEAAAGENPRQTAYALSLLGQVETYDISPLLKRHAESASAEIRARVFEVAAARRVPGLEAAAQAELTRGNEMAESAVAYLIAVSADPSATMRNLLEGSDDRVAQAAVHAGQPGGARLEWVEAAANDTNPQKRLLAAAALAVTGEAGLPIMERLLGDADPGVVRETVCSAGKLRRPELIPALLPLLARPALRADVLESLAAYGDSVCDTLGGLLNDESLPQNIRVQVPRALKLIRTQKSVDVLVNALGHGDLAIRSSVLRALNRLRNTTPSLDFHQNFVTEQILAEARGYFEMNAAFAPFGEGQKPRTAAGLLAKTIEQRLEESVERLFRLLGLRYPPVEMYSVFLAYRGRKGEELSTALEFLDNILDKDLKRIVLPMLDEPSHIEEMGRRLFGVEPRNAEGAIRELIQCNDTWLVACAIAAARELGLNALAPDIREASKRSGQAAAIVADQALEVLA